jgi:hypothetical protein
VSEREHGTKARYVMGPDENGNPGRPCRCKLCARANRDYENHRARMVLYGQWKPYVDAGPAREHVRMLGRNGIGWKRAAALAGVSSGAMGRLLYGGPGERPPSRRIRPETEAAIISVRPSPEALGDSAPVDAAGTHRRVQALACNGWSLARICGRLGMLRSNFGALMDRGQVTAATARAVRALYDELWDQAPPEGTHHEKAAASRARNYARARGWAPPAAWDDDRIDDPQAAPEDWKRPARRGARELAEEARELTRFGLTRQQAAERLGVNLDALQAALRRNPEAA